MGGPKSKGAQAKKLALLLNCSTNVTNMEQRGSMHQSLYFNELTEIAACFKKESKRNVPLPHLVNRLDNVIEKFRKAVQKKTGDKLKDDASLLKWQSLAARKPFQLLQKQIAHHQARCQSLMNHALTNESTSPLSDIRLKEMKISPMRDMDDLFPPLPAAGNVPASENVQQHHDLPLSPLSASLQRPKMFPAVHAVQAPVNGKAGNESDTLYCDTASLNTLILAHSQHREKKPACASSSLNTRACGRTLGHQKLIGECTQCRESFVIAATPCVKVTLPDGKEKSVPPVILRTMCTSLLSGDTTASTQRMTAGLGLGTIQPQSSSEIEAKILGPIIIDLSKKEIKANIDICKKAARIRGDIRIVNGEEYYMLAGSL